MPTKSAGENVIGFLGPVDDLESYVKADWWRHLFNANYLRTDGDVVADPEITRREVDLFIQVLKPEKESSILDLCCGQGRHAMDLADRGYVNITGLDRSHYLISRARSLSKQEGKKVAFKEGDARKLSFPSAVFDYVLLAGNSFGYFESREDDLKVLNEIARVLKPKAPLLIDVTDGNYIREQYQPRSWEWIDKNYFVCRERTLSSDNDRLISREVISHAKKGVIADQFYAERLYTNDSLGKLLKDAGFQNILFHSELAPASKRNQDLGMMARRIIVSARTKKRFVSIPGINGKTKNIAVLLGDPGKSDIIKPDQGFDDDDFLTINIMKKALGKLKRYHFSYFDHHDIFIKRLQESGSGINFVFNLCDEGFNNDASMELHVPSLLEMLGIPYTGASPQCLAHCYDKSLVRGIAKEMDIPVPKAFLINPEDISYIELQLDFPVIVKPNFGDSSFGITHKSVCHNLEALENVIIQVRSQFGYNKPILVEAFLPGKDISVGIIGNPPESYQVLPIIEEDYSALPSGLPKICGYEAKWLPDSPYWNIKSVPASLPEKTEGFLVASCIKLFQRLGCRDYARFDWRLDLNETPRLLEANPNPGWCWDGHLAKMAKLEGISYVQMLNEILKSCERRISTYKTPEMTAELSKAI
ncbi:methyltransferase domain-containing protein [Fibrobacterota bacterium]